MEVEKVEIVKATYAQEPLAKSLWELLLYDLSEFTDESWMGEDGEWQPPWGPWKAPDNDDHRPEPVQNFFAYVDDRPAGFACVAFAPRVFLSPGREIAMAQFIVLKAYRRRGIGRQFAHALFARFPGKWEIGYYEKNLPAHQFWNAVVDEFTGGDYSPAPVYSAPDTAPVPGLHFISRGLRG
jgi:predicted acetyltransferase